MESSLPTAALDATSENNLYDAFGLSPSLFHPSLSLPWALCLLLPPTAANVEMPSAKPRGLHVDT